MNKIHADKLNRIRMEKYDLNAKKIGYKLIDKNKIEVGNIIMKYGLTNTTTIFPLVDPNHDIIGNISINNDVIEKMEQTYVEYAGIEFCGFELAMHSYDVSTPYIVPIVVGRKWATNNTTKDD